MAENTEQFEQTKHMYMEVWIILNLHITNNNENVSLVSTEELGLVVQLSGSSLSSGKQPDYARVDTQWRQ